MGYDTIMASESSSRPTRRKPTKRETTTRRATRADTHYSKLTRKSTLESTSRDASRRTRREQAPAASTRRSDSRSDERHDASTARGYESLTHGAQRKVYGSRRPKREQGNTLALIVGILVIAAFLGGGFMFWTHRSVSITINGESEKVRVSSTLNEVYQDLGINTSPGDFVSVGGNVIEEDKGYAFEASVDGDALSRKQIREYRIKGGEQITMTDGGDRTEDYDVEYRETQPKLVFEGNMGSVSFIKQWGKVGKQEIRHGRQSGETADGEWVDELKDCIVMTKNLTPANGEKLVAITFDDGPAATYTETYLDILAEHNAKATFFNLSPNQTEYPEIVQKLAASGNQIMSHTNQHLQLSTLGKDELLSEINTAHTTIQEVSGVDTTIIRPPYGDFNNNCWLLSGGAISATVIWNQDTLDWQLPGSDAIVANALANVQPGSIILMHDGGGDRSQDIEALPQIIESLQADGYKLVTVSELMASDPDVPKSIAAGNATMPKSAVWPTEIGEATTDAG